MGIPPPHGPGTLKLMRANLMTAPLWVQVLYSGMIFGAGMALSQRFLQHSSCSGAVLVGVRGGAVSAVLFAAFVLAQLRQPHRLRRRITVLQDT